MSWSLAQEAFAAALPNYEDRAEQTRLASAIARALSRRHQLAAQAGCGTGKSFALLVAAIDWSLESGQPVVIGTATKALQEQYRRDLPFLQRTLPVTFTWAVVKGRANYMCKAKLAEKPDVPNLSAIEEELDSNENHDGDLDNMITEVDPKFRLNLVSTSDECPGKKSCRFGEVCYAEQAKERATDANVVIANHSVVITDSQVRSMTDGKGGLLPEYGAIGIDEAHELEEYATSSLGNAFTERSLERLGVDVGELLETLGVSGNLTAAAHKLFKSLELELDTGNGRTIALTDALLVQYFEAVEAVLNEIKYLHAAVVDLRVHGDDRRSMQRKWLMRRTENAHGRLEAILTAQSDELVRWVERDDKRGVVLKYAPLFVGDYLRAHVWRGKPVVLMSATLALGDDFSFLASRLGLDDDFVGFDAGSPFDFSKQSKMYVPGGDFPEPTRDKNMWKARVAAEVGELLKASGGRGLLLFTSKTAMNECYNSVAPTIKRLGFKVLKQGDAPVGELARRFKADETSVLFALKSFMTGADFQGDCLRMVVVDKLPFAVPDDVIVKARNDATDAQVRADNPHLPDNRIPFAPGGSFNVNTVPSMALTLFQAAGRLIRTKTDKGLIVIFDPRLRTKPYGSKILKALPPSPQLSTLDEAREYLDELEGQHATTD